MWEEGAHFLLVREKELECYGKSTHGRDKSSLCDAPKAMNPPSPIDRVGENNLA
jgi:hypothetical protein